MPTQPRASTAGDWMRRLLLGAALLAAATSAEAAVPGEVTIDSGTLAGTTGSSPDIRVFKGIPFAAPPVGANRWRPPQPVAKWPGIRAASEYAPRCTQGGGGGPNAAAAPPSGEDCLYLNVWTAAETAGDRRPVMVWFYGGGFFGGAAAFGRDPDNVTIFGESACANLTSALVGSPEAKDLFRRAIAQSGGFMGLGMARMGTLRRAEEAGAKALSDAGVASIAELREKPAQEVFTAIRGGNLVVDGYLIAEDLSQTFANSRQNAVDLVVGSNKDEGTFFQRPGLTAEQFRAQAKQRFGVLAGGYLKMFPASSDAEAAASYLASFSDEASWHMRKFAALQAKQGNDAYVYYFSRVPPAWPDRPSPFGDYQGASRGATHVAEIPYMFDNLAPPSPWTEVDRRLADVMSSYWVNFARTGDPNGAGLPVWPAYRDAATGKAQVLGDTVTTEAATLPAAATLAFFDLSYQQLLKGGANQ